jgi:hypothetical protein
MEGRMADVVPTLVTAIAAVMGTLVGGLTSFATSYVVQRRQGHSERVLRDLERREDLYAKFNELGAQLLLDSLDHELQDPVKLVGIETLAGRVRLASSAPVLKAAEDVIAHILDSYERPAVDARQAIRTAPRQLVEPLITFTKACRKERLDMLRDI